MKPAKVTLGDTINHKRHLDESIIKVRYGLQHCHAYDDAKRKLLVHHHFNFCAMSFRPLTLSPSLLSLLRAQLSSPALLQILWAASGLQTFEDLCHENGLELEEDLSWANAKMSIMALASVSALVAQFYPLTFPDNIWLLGVCVVIYFFLSGVLQYMVTFLDKDNIYCSKAIAGEGSAGGVARLYSTLPKGSQWYGLRVEIAGREVMHWNTGVAVPGQVGDNWDKNKVSVGNFYQEDGFLVPDRVREFLERDLKGFFEGRKKAAGAGKVGSSSSSSSSSGKASGAPANPAIKQKPKGE